MPDRVVVISSETIKLDAFLKWAGLAQTGGEAKQWVQAGVVAVNGAQERRRGRRLRPGDRVSVAGHATLVVVRPV